MKTKTAKTKPPMPPRHFPDDIDEILHGYGQRARVVQLWRQLDGKHNEWTYLGRLHPSESGVERVANRFGGGWYRAKILGAWDPELRREGVFRAGLVRDRRTGLGSDGRDSRAHQEAARHLECPARSVSSCPRVPRPEKSMTRKSRRCWSKSIGEPGRRVRLYEARPGGPIMRSVFVNGKEVRKSLKHRDKEKAIGARVVRIGSHVRNQQASRPQRERCTGKL